MSKLALRVQGISKRYQIGRLRERTLRGQAASLARRFFAQHEPVVPPSDTIWALNDVSFDLEPGEVLGVIGTNGSGKSTLLRILARVTRPTTGWFGVNGRIGSLLGVGTGFSPELTGRENIYLNGALLGLKRADVAQRFDEIVAFSEIEQFLDTPVKHYSSGMYVRLAFSVAAHLVADILLIDEVLAVGDVAFQRKSLTRMEQLVRDEGRTILFVSHSTGAVASLCTRCIYLERGQLIDDDLPDAVIERYLRKTGSKAADATPATAPHAPPGTTRITSIQFHEPDSLQPLAAVRSGQDVVIKVDYQSAGAPDNVLRDVVVDLAFYNSAGHFVTTAHSAMARGPFDQLPATGTLYCTLPGLPLMEGKYRVAADMIVEGRTVSHAADAATLFVEPADYYRSGYQMLDGRQGLYMEQHWCTQREPNPANNAH